MFARPSSVNREITALDQPSGRTHLRAGRWVTCIDGPPLSGVYSAWFVQQTMGVLFYPPWSSKNPPCGWGSPRSGREPLWGWWASPVAGPGIANRYPDLQAGAVSTHEGGNPFSFRCRNNCTYLAFCPSIRLLGLVPHLFAFEDGQSSKLFERRSKTRHSSQSWCREIGRCA